VADEKKFLSLQRIEPRFQLKGIIKHIYEIAMKTTFENSDRTYTGS